MDCSIVRDLLPLYTDGLTAPETDSFIRRHLRECPECAKILARLQAPIEAPPEDEAGRILRALQRKKRRSLTAAAIVCVLFLGVLLAVWLPARARFVTYQTKLDSTDPTVLLREEPRLAVTQEEILLGNMLLSHPAVLDAFAALESDTVLLSLPQDQLEPLLSQYLPGDLTVTEIGVRRHGILLTCWEDNTSIILEYADGDGTGYTDLLQKTISTPDGDGKVSYIYSVLYHTAVGRAEYERRKISPDFLPAS